MEIIEILVPRIQSTEKKSLCGEVQHVAHNAKSPNMHSEGKPTGLAYGPGHYSEREHDAHSPARAHGLERAQEHVHGILNRDPWWTMPYRGS